MAAQVPVSARALPANTLLTRARPGTCKAYTCTPPETPAQMKDCDGYWTFFWVSGHGKESGVGTGCIRDPNTGECGCEDSDGTFVAGSSSCT
jgi:hypothetical protein